MPVIYTVTIKSTEKKNRFHITWHNTEGNTVHSFNQDAEITLEESRRLWQWPRCQLPIGEKLFRFLDGDNRHFQQALDRANQLGEPLQIHLHSCKQIEDWPFELLAHGNTFLLPHRLHLVRTVSDWGAEKNIPPKDRPLKLLFMACSALDVKPELDFEREEEAIFYITEKLSIDMEVEDSGSLEGLRSQLEQEQYDVVHLSGHADIDKNGRPYFIMEDETGYQQRVYPDMLWNGALIENPPRLLFLSGCRTGEVPDSSGISDTPENTAEGSFARLLVESDQVPAVLGWGRSVSDKEASLAGEMIFHELSRGRSILEAVQRARFELITNFSNSEKPAWPLLRLYSNGMPLNGIVKIKKDQRWQLKPRRMKHVFLKNSQVKVLMEGFVGRRRQLQNSLCALKQDNDKVGVVLLGTGGLGKSCLAGKICERFFDHILIIVHGRFNTITLENALTDAFIASQDETGQEILSQKLEMADKLTRLCTTSFKEKNYLLLLDDFEQNLEGAEKGQPGPLLPEAADLLNVLLRHLPFSGKMTQMIITSRYEFSLMAQDRNLIEECLEKVWLTSFREAEQRKKLGELQHIFNYENQSKVSDLLAAGHGNPRLMEWVDVLVGQMKAEEVSQLVEAIKNKQEDFIRTHVIRELLQRGGLELEKFLHWFSIYRRPVLVEGAAQVAEKADLAAWKELLKRGMSLSLIEYDQAHRSYAVTPLLREELLTEIDYSHLRHCHKAAFEYYKRICGPMDYFDPLLVEEWVFHALGCGEESVATHQGGLLVDFLCQVLAFQESRRVGEWVLAEKKQELATEHDALLLNELAYTINQMGDHQEAIEYFEKALKIDETVFGREHRKVAIRLNNLGSAWMALGDYRKTITCYERAITILKKTQGEKHQDVATTLGNLGTVWHHLGDFSKAAECLEKALEINKAVLGSRHPNIARDLNNLGEVCRELRELRKAIAYYEQALSILEAEYGEHHPDVATGFNNLGEAWRNLGEPQKAISYYNQALSITIALFGKAHPDAALILNNLGLAWRALGEPLEAALFFKNALATDEECFGRHHPNIARGLGNLGLTSMDIGDYYKAISYFEQALDIDTRSYGKNHAKVAADLINLGSAWQHLGEKLRAIEYYEQALPVLKEVYGNQHPQVAIGLNNLGTAWRDLKELRKAIKYYERALGIDEAVLGREHPDVAKRLNNLGAVYLDMGQKRKAKDYFEESFKIYDKFFGPEHPDTRRVIEWLMACR